MRQALSKGKNVEFALSVKSDMANWTSKTFLYGNFHMKSSSAAPSLFDFIDVFS